MSEPKKRKRAPLNRRDAIWLMLTAGAGTAAAGAFALNDGDQAQVEALQQEVQALRRAATGSNVDLESLVDTNASSQAEITRLLTEIAQKDAQIAQFQSALTQAQQALATSEQEKTILKSEISKRAESLAQSEGEKQILAGLIQRWEALDGVGLDDAVLAGMATLSTTWGNFGKFIPSLNDGYGIADAVLSGFETTISGLRTSVSLITDRVAFLDRLFGTVQTAVANALDRTGDVLQPFAEFARNVVSKLPFGTGDRIEIALTSISDLLNNIPGISNDTTAMVLTPFARHLGTDNQSWLATIVQPLRENTLGPISNVVSTYFDADKTIAEQVKRPTEDKVAEWQRVRREIEDYKAANDVDQILV